jgi:FixJ family two-component response regulator
MAEETARRVPLISIVDDDLSIRIAMENLVKSIGFDVRSFESADQYLKSSVRRETSCIVSDVQMPGISGLDLQSNLAAEEDRTPIIFITAFPHPDIERRALDAGAVCFLTKPFDGQRLINCIEDALKGRHGACLPC